MHSNPTRKAMTRWSSLCGAVLFAIGVFSAPTIASAKCVNYVSPMQTKTITSAGQNTTFYFSGLPATSGRTAVAVIDLYGDFDYSSEYADIYINSTLVGQHNPTGGQCNTSLQYGNNSTRGFVLPGFTGGTVSVRVDASASVGSWCSGSSTDRIVVKIMYVQTNCTSVCSSSTFNKITSPNPVCLLHNPDKPYCAGVLAGSVHTQALKTTRRIVLLTQIHHIVSTISAYNVRPMQIVHRRIHVTKPVGNVSAQAEIAPKSVTRATAPTRTRFVRPLTHPSLTATTNSAVSVRLLH